MEVAEERNRGVAVRKEGEVKTHRAPAHMTSSFAFADFDDLFEEERDHSSNHASFTMINSQSRSSLGVVDDVNFDPFKEIGETSTSFYQSDRDQDPTTWMNENEIAEKNQTKNVESNQRKKKSDKQTKINRRTTGSHFSSLSASCHQPRRCEFPIFSSSRTLKGEVSPDRNNRRPSISNVSLSSQSCHNLDRGHSKFAKTMSGRKGQGSFSSAGEVSDDSDDDDMVERPVWRLNLSTHSSPKKRVHHRPSPTGLVEADESLGFAAPVTPGRVMLGVKQQCHSSHMPSAPNLPTPQRHRRASMSGTQMLPSPKKSPMKMARRETVSNGGTNSATSTPRHSRRASVSNDMEMDKSTRRRKTKQSKKDCTLNDGEEINEDTVKRIIREHLAKQRKQKKKGKTGDKQPQVADEKARQSSQPSTPDDENEESEEVELLHIDDGDYSERCDDSDNTSAYCSLEGDDSFSSFSSSHSTANLADDTNNCPIETMPNLLPRHVSADGDEVLFDMAHAAQEGREEPGTEGSVSPAGDENGGTKKAKKSRKGKKKHKSPEPDHIAKSEHSSKGTTSSGKSKHKKKSDRTKEGT